jgi:hypothetical protein
MGGRLRDWWKRLTGRGGEEPAAPRPATHDLHPRSSTPAPDPSGELKIADGGAAAGNKPQHSGAGGFDPYSSDAGYQKPHSWEHVDHD